MATITFVSGLWPSTTGSFKNAEFAPALQEYLRSVRERKHLKWCATARLIRTANYMSVDNYMLPKTISSAIEPDHLVPAQLLDCSCPNAHIPVKALCLPLFQM